jgi:hypothetical protein
VDAVGGGGGRGGGFGLGGRPVGAFVLENGNVRWKPAFDATRIAQQALIGVGLLALLALLRRGG